MDFPVFLSIVAFIVQLLDRSFVETCISGILSSQKSLPPSFMHKHVDNEPRHDFKFHDTRTRTCYTANIALSAALVFQKH